MNLAQTLSILAGGPGSGCHGDNCGRPVGKSGVQRTALHIAREGQEKQAAHIRRAVPLEEKKKFVGGKPTPESVREAQKTGATMPGALHVRPGEAKMLPRWLGKRPFRDDRKLLDEQRKSGAKDMQEWQKQHPPVKTVHNPQGIQDGDKAVTTRPVQAWNERSWNRKTFPAGSPVTVIRLSPVVGKNEAMAVVKFGKHASEELVALKDLQLLQKGKINTPQIDPAEVRPSRTISKSTTADGAAYTFVRPKGSVDDDDVRGKSKPHALKGEFKDVTGVVKVLLEPNQRAQVFSAQPRGASPPEWIKTPVARRYVGNDQTITIRHGGALRQLGTEGATVFVYRSYNQKERTGYDSKGRETFKTYKAITVVREVGTGQYGNVHMRERRWEYKNPQGADNFVGKRYGIKLSMPKRMK